MDLKLKDKRVLVTGSSRGIGRAIAYAFLQEGARVILSSNNSGELEQAYTELAAEFGESRVLAKICDYTDAQQIHCVVETVQGLWGGLDILVANIGNGKSKSDPITDSVHFNAVFDINFTVAVNAVRECYASIQQARGSIVFISSITGIEAFGAPVDYSTAKAAVIAFSKNLARKVARDGVRVNCIAPGNVFFQGSVWDEKIQQDKLRVEKIINDTVPMNRFARPEEIADACVFLASDRASFITGALLCVDGGQTVSF